jgi:4-hydroxybenzoate polyprenyltransferase
LQHPVSKIFRQYLLLIRLPNIFTTPSNILTGYLAAVSVAQASSTQLLELTISSAFLYVAGIVFNDYFDIEIDRRERPSRPLPSGTISRRRALAIAVGALLIGNVIALFLGLVSLAVSIGLSIAIFAYDYRLKRGKLGPFAMGSTRFLNVILGASPLLLFTTSTSNIVILTAAASMFLYVLAITLLSKNEASDDKPKLIIISLIISGVIGVIISLGFFVQFHWAFLLNLSIFAAMMIFSFKQHLVKDSPCVQKAVRNMVISIIVLDSVFISGTSGPFYGFTTLLLIVPTVLLAKKLYVT